MNVEMGLTERELGCKKEAEMGEESQGSSTILLGAATDLHGIGDQFADTQCPQHWTMLPSCWRKSGMSRL
jgi:hypothetical protein